MLNRTLEYTESIKPISADAAGTKEPIWAKIAIIAHCLLTIVKKTVRLRTLVSYLRNVLFPPMLGL